MIYLNNNKKLTGGSFTFDGKVKAISNNAINKDIFKEFWNRFSYTYSDLEITEINSLEFIVGNPQKIELNGNSYAINVDNNGIYLVGDNTNSLIWAFMTLIDQIKIREENNKTSLLIECFTLAETPLIKNRIVHYCIFPETKLYEFERFIRFCGALKYTHIILEFWGMLKYDALSELAWDNAFTKEEIKPIINLANDLGIEVVPMLNCWGHASSSRVIFGKHVVLDQNLSLASYFTEDGWCWDIKKDKVKILLSKMRNELIELCGSGNYFHIGCDEAYNFNLRDKENMDLICDYVNEIALELKEKNRKTIMWGDMLISRRTEFNPKNRYCCYSPSIDSEKYMLNKISKDIIIADWQYTCEYAPVETALIFKDAGFNVALCPWDRSAEQLYSCTTTVKDNELFGFIHTTWNSLAMGMPYVAIASVTSFENSAPSLMTMRPRTAGLLRKVYDCKGEYEKSGWANIQTGVGIK